MKNARFGINLGMGFDDVPLSEQAAILKSVGYSSCFSCWYEGFQPSRMAAMIESAGLEYQSIHAPFNQVHLMWEDPGEAGDAAADQLFRCVKDCQQAGVKIMVAHTIIGMERHSPTPLGIERFSRVVRAAEECGVTIAFENTEGVEYLQAVMDAFKNSHACGFCWDTGHEMCYNFGENMMGRFGDRLVATHLNDNFGITEPPHLTWLDDSHVLPFDGKADWQSVVDRLDNAGYQGIYTMEVFRDNKPGRHTQDPYQTWNFETFVTTALERVKILASLSR